MRVILRSNGVVRILSALRTVRLSLTILLPLTQWLVGAPSAGMPRALAQTVEYRLILRFTGDLGPVEHTLSCDKEYEIWAQFYRIITDAQGRNGSIGMVQDAEVAVQGEQHGTITPAIAPVERLPTMRDGFQVPFAARFIYKPDSEGSETLQFAGLLGNRNVVQNALKFKVENCKFRSVMIFDGQISEPGFTWHASGLMDEVTLEPDETGHAVASGSFETNSLFTVTDCSLSHTTLINPTTLTAQTDKDSLHLSFEFEPGEVTVTLSCGGEGGSATGAGDPSRLGIPEMTFPLEGGVVTFPSQGFPGSVIVIVTRVSGQAPISWLGARTALQSELFEWVLSPGMHGWGDKQ